MPSCVFSYYFANFLSQNKQSVFLTSNKWSHFMHMSVYIVDILITLNNSPQVGQGCVGKCPYLLPIAALLGFSDFLRILFAISFKSQFTQTAFQGLFLKRHFRHSINSTSSSSFFFLFYYSSLGNKDLWHFQHSSTDKGFLCLHDIFGHYIVGKLSSLIFFSSLSYLGSLILGVQHIQQAFNGPILSNQHVRHLHF